MGISSNAILFYGYAWEDVEGSTPPLLEGEDPDIHEDFGWEAVYADRFGVKRPDHTYPDGILDCITGRTSHTPDEQAVIDEYKKYWALRRALIASSGVEVDIHCSASYPAPFVCITSSKHTAYRGDVAAVTSLKVGTDWDDVLNEFCKVMGYDVSGLKPGWYLVSYAGF